MRIRLGEGLAFIFRFDVIIQGPNAKHTESNVEKEGIRQVYAAAFLERETVTPMSPTHPQPQAVVHGSRPDTIQYSSPRRDCCHIYTDSPLPLAAAQPAEPREGDTCHVQQQPTSTITQHQTVSQWCFCYKAFRHLVFGVGNPDEKEVKNG